MSDDIGKWYEDKRLEAVRLSEQIKQVKRASACSCTKFRICVPCDDRDKEIKKLEKQLEMARYVGD